MVGFTCCVPGCSNNSNRDKVGYHSFPKDQRLREEWIAKVGRAGNEGPFSKFVPTTGHKVCGVHFEGGRKTYMTRVPTVFPHVTRSKKPKIRQLLRQPVATPQVAPFQNAVHATPEVLVGVVDYPFQNVACIKQEVVDEAADSRFQNTAYIKEEVVDEAADSRFQNTACIRQEVVDQAEDNPCSTQLCHWCQEVLVHVSKANKGTGTIRRNEVGTQTKPVPLCSNEPQVEVGVETSTPTTCSTLADNAASTRSQSDASAEPPHDVPSASPPHASSYCLPSLVSSPASGSGFMDILSSWNENLQGRQRCHNNGSVDVEDNKKYVIFESFLLSLFRSCGSCHQPCKAVVAVSDAGVSVATECGNGHSGSWTTSPNAGWTNH